MGIEDPTIGLNDISDELAIPLDPFISFKDQSYHLLNMSDFSHKNLAKLGTLQRLFLIKYCLSTFDHGSDGGHISQLIVSASEWDPSVLQLCVDLCQINAIDFAMSNWLDLIHSCECVDRGLFFSRLVDLSYLRLMLKWCQVWIP